MAAGVTEDGNDGGDPEVCSCTSAATTTTAAIMQRRQRRRRSGSNLGICCQPLTAIQVLVVMVVLPLVVMTKCESAAPAQGSSAPGVISRLISVVKDFFFPKRDRLYEGQQQQQQIELLREKKSSI